MSLPPKPTYTPGSVSLIYVPSSQKVIQLSIHQDDLTDIVLPETIADLQELIPVLLTHITSSSSAPLPNQFILFSSEYKMHLEISPWDIGETYSFEKIDSISEGDQIPQIIEVWKDKIKITIIPSTPVT